VFYTVLSHTVLVVTVYARVGTPALRRVALPRTYVSRPQELRISVGIWDS